MASGQEGEARAGLVGRHLDFGRDPRGSSNDGLITCPSESAKYQTASRVVHGALRDGDTRPRVKLCVW